jgi:flagellar FliL protein
VFKNKIFILAVSILIAITLILVAAFVLWNFMDKTSSSADPAEAAKTAASKVKPTKPPTAAEVQANTVIIKDVLTNLSSNKNFVKLSLAFEMENAKAKTEFDHLVESTVKGTVVRILADVNPEQIQGSKGQDFLTSALLNKLNPLMQDGKIRQIWITDMVLQ